MVSSQKGVPKKNEFLGEKWFISSGVCSVLDALSPGIMAFKSLVHFCSARRLNFSKLNFDVFLLEFVDYPKVACG